MVKRETAFENAGTASGRALIPEHLRSSRTLSAGSVPTNPTDAKDPKSEVVLPEKDRNGHVTQWYRLGPAELTGRALSGAQATINPEASTTTPLSISTGECTKRRACDFHSASGLFRK